MHYYNNYQSIRMIRPPVMNQKPKRLARSRSISLEWMNQSTLLLAGFFAFLVLLCAVFMGRNLAMSSHIQNLESEISRLTSMNSILQRADVVSSSMTTILSAEHEVPEETMMKEATVETPVIVEEPVVAEVAPVAAEPYMEVTTEAVVEEVVTEPQIINTSDITSPSNLTAGEIDEVIMATHETYGYANSGSMLHGIGQYLYNAEQTYGINALYILSVATWEGGWGTSNGALNYNNSYGLMTSSGLMRFDSVEEGVMDFARRMREYYFDCGKTDPYSIGKKYCPGNATRWGDKISLIISMYADHV